MKKILSSAAALAVALSAHALTWVENFSTAPAAHGWEAYGQTNLFSWNTTNQNLAVTWDSAQPNSYFTRATGTNLTAASDFLVAFDLRLADIAVGANTNRPLTFEIALGLHNLAQATNVAFVRGSGFQSPNLVEFDYFPNDIFNFGDTVSTPVISSDNNFASGGFTAPFSLATGALYHVTMIYTAANRLLHTALTSNGVPVGPVQDTRLGATFGDFAVDHFAVASYNDDGQFPGFEGSVLAHGTVDNVLFASPPPVGTFAGALAGNQWQTTFNSDTNWLYTLERSADLATWTAASATTPGNGGSLTLSDTNPPAPNILYRVRAELP